jgi:isopentenyldiphosphate isomerase
LCDDRGRPIGRVKARGLVHRDGDWHRSFHCWVVVPGEDVDPAILLQQRSPGKDTCPGLWDVSVGGHYRAGEDWLGGLREIEEELGLRVEADELVQVGWRRDDLRHANGLIDREIQDVFFLKREVDLARLAPDPTEVTAVALIRADFLAALARGGLAAVDAPGGRVSLAGSVAAETLRLRPEDLVPRANDYYGKVARFARELVSGTARVERRRWW